MAYRVHEYGITRILSGEDILVDQLYARCRYWNRLVEIERGYQESKERVLGDASIELLRLSKAVAVATERVDEALAARARLRSQERTLRVPEALTAEIKGLWGALRRERKEYRETRRGVFEAPGVKDALKALGVRRTAAVREARHQFGLYWGNYLDVELAYKTARRKAGNRLRFQRPTPEGAVSVWFQHGLPTEAVWGQDRRLTIAPVPEEAWTSDVRAVRRRLARTKVWMRLGTEPDRTPRLLEAEMVMHRPLPRGLVRHASVIRERLGTHWRYRLVISVAVEDKQPANGQPAVGIDIGWRLFPNRLRVAVAVGEDGYVEELALPQEMLAGFDQVRGLQAIRDQHFNGVKAVVVAMVCSPPSLVTPDWLRQQAATIAQWRSQRRLAALAVVWRENRFEGDNEAYAMVEAWRKKDKHLLEWQANLRDKLLARRREMYRVWVAETARRYKAVVLEDFDLRGVAKMTTRMRFEASLSQLRTVLEHTCAREGLSVVKVPAQYTTQECSYCANREQFDAREEVRHRCSRCGSEWDQDENAARNLLRILRAVEVGGNEV